MGFNADTYVNEHVKDNIILNIKCNIDNDVINYVLDTVEERMITSCEYSKLRKKVYNVLVESLQNLYHHVGKAPVDFEYHDMEKFGMVVIQKIEYGYRIITGNFIAVENVANLEHRLDCINKSSREEIKEMYKFILNHQHISAKGGGGLGLVDIAKRTGRKLDYTFIKYNDDCYFFYLDITIEEKEKDKVNIQ